MRRKYKNERDGQERNVRTKSDGLKGVEALLESLEERRGREERSSRMRRRSQSWSLSNDGRSMSPRRRAQRNEMMEWKRREDRNYSGLSVKYLC
jgi:hypothetical protein